MIRVEMYCSHTRVSNRRRDNSHLPVLHNSQQKSRKQSTSCSSIATPWHGVVDVVWHLGDVGLASYLGRYRLLKTLLIVLPIVFPPCILLASASSKADWVTEASARVRLASWEV